MDRIKFIKEYKNEAEPIYIEIIKKHFRENVILDIYIDSEKFKFLGGLNEEFSKMLNHMVGSTTAINGYYYEKRVYIVDKVMKKIGENTVAQLSPVEILELAGITNYSKPNKVLKISKVDYYLPKVVKEEIFKFSEGLYYNRGVRNYYTDGLKKIFKLMVDNYGIEEVYFNHDLDNAIKTKYNKIFLIESKTKERKQGHGAWEDVRKLIETWAALTYGMLKQYRTSSKNNVIEPKWNTISILYLMNDKDEYEIEKDIKYFPRFRSNNISKGGCITAKEFYKYFFGVDMEDILAVEKYLASYIAIHKKNAIDYLWKKVGLSEKEIKENLNEYINSINE